MRREQLMGRPFLVNSTQEAVRTLLHAGCQIGALLLMPFTARHHEPFSFHRRPHTCRTIMLVEIRRMVASCWPVDAGDDYLTAIHKDNRLGRRTAQWT
jgi:hypothetical protein